MVIDAERFFPVPPTVMGDKPALSVVLDYELIVGWIK
jgi:hypothetical protein